MTKERLVWIDLAKVISIVLVTYYHANTLHEGYGAHLVQLLRMPAFFLIAGFLFDDRKFPSLWSLLKHRFRQLMIPYLCFEALLIPFTNQGWEQLLQATVNALWGHPTTCIPLWFLVCLFGMQIIHYVGIRIIEHLTQGSWREHTLLLLVLYVSISLSLSPLDLPDHFQLNAIVCNLPFYVAANCYKNLIRQITWKRTPVIITFCLFFGLTLVWVKANLITENGTWTSGAIYYLTHILAGLCLLPPYIACCKLIGNAMGHSRLVEYLGSNTIIILIFHTYFISAISSISVILFNHDILSLNPVITYGIVLLIVMAHYPIIRIINRWLPWMLGRGRQTGVR